MMTAPLSKGHQRIASKRQRLLLESLERHAPLLAAYQRLGINIGPAVANHDRKPHIAMLDAAIRDRVDDIYRGIPLQPGAR